MSFLASCGRVLCYITRAGPRSSAVPKWFLRSLLTSRQPDGFFLAKLKERCGASLFEKDLQLAITINQGTRHLRIPLMIAPDESVDRVAGNTDQRVGSLRDVSNLLHVVGCQVGNQIPKAIHVNDLSHQSLGFPFRLRDREGLAVVDESPKGRERLLPGQPGRSRGEEVATVEGVAW